MQLCVEDMHVEETQKIKATLDLRHKLYIVKAMKKVFLNQSLHNRGSIFEILDELWRQTPCVILQVEHVE